MLKTIDAKQLRVGMHVCDLGRHWLDHPFPFNRFTIKDPTDIRKIIAAGIRTVSIDTDKGDDLPATEPPPAPVPPAAAEPAVTRASVAEESVRAKALFREATGVIHSLMLDARVGKQVEVQTLDPLAERMVRSTLRNRHALSGMTRIKNKDEYTFMHSVSVAGLLVAFGVELQLDEDTLHRLAIGGMVHDIGKTLVPDHILNKPGALADDEFQIMKQHVTYSRELLAQQVDIDPIALDVTLQHHERMDGQGYPDGLREGTISQFGRMAAIVDVYDALTSVRVYKSAWEPSVALKKLIEWSPDKFDPALVQHFIRCLGIYPVGSLVELTSGRLGIVLDQGRDVLRPRVRIVYNTRNQNYVQVRDVDLGRQDIERIKAVRAPAEFGIELSNFI